MYRNNDKFQYLMDAHLMASARPQYQSIARYTPSVARLYEARRRDRPDDVVVRYVADAYAGGFWKTTGARIEFIGVDSPGGQRLVVVLEALGVPLPDRWR